MVGSMAVLKAHYSTAGSMVAQMDVLMAALKAHYSTAGSMVG